MRIKTKDGAIHEVVDLTFETRRTLSGYVCDDGNTYPAGECEVVKPEPQYKRAWVPEYEEDYWSVLGDGVHITEDRNYNFDYDKNFIKSGNVYHDKATAEAESKYISALRRIRNVIRENNQFASFDSPYYSIEHYDDGLNVGGCFAAETGKLGGIYVKDKEFAEWLLQNYADDLKILAGVQDK